MSPVLTLPMLTPETSDLQSSELLGGAKKNLGFVPNMYAEMANVPGLLSTYLHGYDWFRKHSSFTPAEQEVVFLSISRENACHYCMAAHSMIAEAMSKVPSQAIEALRHGQDINDPRLRALAKFAGIMVRTRGNPTREDVQTFIAAGYSEQQALQILLAVAIKTISNYSNHLFKTPLDPVFARYQWREPSAA